jgi:hypothetical protein
MFADATHTRLWMGLHGFLLIKRLQLPGWGVNDCNLMVADWIDQLNGTTQADSIRGKYTDERSALRFQKNYTPAPVWLTEQGYAESNAALQEGNIVLVEDRGYWRAHIIHAEQVWSCSPVHGVINAPLSSLEELKGKYTTWRKQ